MNTYYKVVTLVHLGYIHVIGPIPIKAERKPRNSKIHSSRREKYYDFFDSLEEAEDFAFYMCDRNFGEDFYYNCTKYGKKKWECGIEPSLLPCRECGFSKKK